MWTFEDDEDRGMERREDKKVGKMTARREWNEMQILNRIQVTVICIGFT